MNRFYRLRSAFYTVYWFTTGRQYVGFLRWDNTTKTFYEWFTRIAYKIPK